MSGCSSAPWAIQERPRQQAEDLAAKLGCPTDPTPDIVDCIRSFTTDSIIKVTIYCFPFYPFVSEV